MNRADNSPYRSRQVAVLATGTVLALALQAASTWTPLLSWVAVVVALATAFLAVAVVAKEFAAWRERMQAEQAAERAQVRENTKVLHERQRQVLATVESENHELRLENAELRVENADLREKLEGQQAEVYSLPRRRVTEDRAGDEPSTVIELDLQRLASPLVAEMQRRHAN